MLLCSLQSKPREISKLRLCYCRTEIGLQALAHKNKTQRPVTRRWAICPALPTDVRRAIQVRHPRCRGCSRSLDLLGAEHRHTAFAP